MSNDSSLGRLAALHVGGAKDGLHVRNTAGRTLWSQLEQQASQIGLVES